MTVTPARGQLKTLDDLAGMCRACGQPTATSICRRIFVDCRTSGAPRVLGYSTRLQLNVVDANHHENQLWHHAFMTQCPTCKGYCPVRLIDWQPKTGPNMHILDLAAFNATPHHCD